VESRGSSEAGRHGPPGAPAERVSYGYRLVEASEKRRLVDRHFDAIARRYVLADSLLSFGLDGRWRRHAIRRLGLRPGERVCDLAGGTADLAILAAREVAPQGDVTICDINMPMMRAGVSRSRRFRHRERLLWAQGDAESLPFPTGVFDAVTAGFGVRNFVHLERGLSEMSRVLKPGGRLMILEFSVPETAWLRALYELYSFKAMPVVGRAVTGTGEPFRYLAESIRVFPAPEELRSRLVAAGFVGVSFERLTDGIAVVYLGERHR
jgi:demethylmenaquinone methyltransferase/2-methoxy-6-polyprenyl-1,4-benzoquinol methylase